MTERAVPHRARRASRVVVVGVRGGEAEEHRLLHRHLDGCAQPRARAIDECRRNRRVQVDAAEDVGHRTSGA